MQEKKVALVTGANKGIGFEIARGLGERGMMVVIGARDEARREAAVARLRSEGHDVVGVALDVTSDHSARTTAEAVADRIGRLDVLVNNAGIGGRVNDGAQDPTELDLDVLRTVLETNVFGVIRVTNAVLPLLRRSPAPRIVNISSNMGSLTLQTGPQLAAYAASKTMLNSITVQYARRFAGEPIIVNAVCPGYVATDFTGHDGTRTPRQGAQIALRLATVHDDGPRGGFFDEAGSVPW
ncbi:SDR family oxidoreductase [Microbacterium sp. MAHUQ-60]|uniref:SDR family oxidoreductase n=1 Tax=unclassified Microbacterium TaxID=2609290 RepID=UPI00361B24CC